MDKIAALTEILAQDPSNAFARYGVAMERAARGDSDAAMAEFDRLIARDPDYLPAYQMSAQTLLQLGLTAAALERLQAGITAANRIGDRHALDEMEAMRKELTA